MVIPPRKYCSSYRQVRKQFHYETDEDSANLNPTENIFLLVLIDNAMALSRAFSANERIHFVCNRATNTVNDKARKAHSLDLHKVLS